MNMPEVEGTDIVEEQNHPANHYLGEEDMNMVDSNMVEVNGMDTVKDHFHPMNHRLDVEGMDMVEEHFHPMNHRLGVEGMDTVDTDMGEDITTEMELVERESEGVVLVRHWSSDGTVRHRRTHQE
jgi:hypothetical protein